ncbi:hypothetical protein [Rodentibacter trehalosifermentans]|uniref:hypothetical protein n=1 Tax=Rodentibacter trehalosifermentans TaxID=1908263 RepID=UPI0009CE483B|nr:hypothetical protein [Rodentibacter trehalosifermentans]OOF47218.1 hypothetical protein BKK53_11480 [Rodentibacter trehalosifermentans]
MKIYEQINFFRANVQAYAEQLKRNGYSYTDKDGKNYQSSTYSAVHKADFVGNKWNLGLTGFNDTTGGECWLCYSHSSYFAEVPAQYVKNAFGNDILDGKGKKIESDLYKDYVEKWRELFFAYINQI